MLINSKQTILSCSISKHGLPTLAEKGGENYNNTGDATIIASSKGGRKKPIYIVPKTELINRDHAYFVIKENDIVVRVTHQDKKFHIKVYEVQFINVEGQQVVLNMIEEYLESNFLEYLNSQYKEAIKHGVNKSTTPKCKIPFFYYEDKNLVEKNHVTARR